MIIGSFSINDNTPSVIGPIREVTDSAGLTFHPVASGDFTGGYYLNARLPYTTADFYFFNEPGDILVLISGSFYNKPELLNLCGITTPVPDPELIAILFRREGPGFVKKLNGDFAIFIGQPAKKQAYLFRDHVGIRSLAYTTFSNTLIFSSDIIGLCRAFSAGRHPDSEYLMGYFRYIDYRKTPDKKVKKLLPGHFIHFSETGVTVTKYWEPERIRVDRKLQYDMMMSDLKSILWDAVRIRSDRRFYAGAHVSSGLDSGIVSTLARKEYAHQENFYGFSWSPADFTPSNVRYDERKIVISFSEKTNIQHLFSTMNTADFQRHVSDYYDNKGFFSEDETVEQAGEANTNLIFSGWGGDEFISTGVRGIETDLLTGFKWKSFFRRNPVTRPKRFIITMLRLVIFPALGITDRATARSFRDNARYLKRGCSRNDRRALSDFHFHISRHQLHLRLLHFYHLQDRCESWAVNGYRKGVEYRYPLLDRRIIEYMLKVPSELLCKNDHYRPLLREVSEGVLPEEVRWQWRKSDPVYWAYMEELFSASADSFIEEIDEWKTNPDLHFIDFDLLTEDIAKYRSQSADVESKVLFRALVYIKAIHEFTKKYCGLSELSRNEL